VAAAHRARIHHQDWAADRAAQPGRSFRRICDNEKVRVIKVHHLRHTVGSLLKDLGVPARDAQTILGHTRISTTLEIYTDTDEQARRDALTRLRGLLGEAEN
jgi:integrase